MQEIIAIFIFSLKLGKERKKKDKIMHIKYFLFIDNWLFKIKWPYKLIHLPWALQGKFEDKRKLL
jgi:hypothetical protein